MGFLADALPDLTWVVRGAPAPTGPSLAPGVSPAVLHLGHAGAVLGLGLAAWVAVLIALLPTKDQSVAWLLACGLHGLGYGLFIWLDRTRRRDVGLHWLADLGRFFHELTRAAGLGLVLVLVVEIGLVGVNVLTGVGTPGEGVPEKLDVVAPILMPVLVAGIAAQHFVMWRKLARRAQST
jgi:hypothetical protein